MAENPMVAVIREELVRAREYAKECEATVRLRQKWLEEAVTLRDLADEDATRRALEALSETEGEEG